jgi:hypothetical protein
MMMAVICMPSGFFRPQVHANRPYERWIAAMVKMRQNGGSFQAIAN